MSLFAQARALTPVFIVSLAASLPLIGSLGVQQPAQANQDKAADPWTSADVLSPSDFAREISAAKRADTLTTIYVGFHTLFEGGHVPGAVFHGTASTEKGVAELQEWLSGVPHSSNLVIYCGCCPFDHCPNIRPAYKLLRGMGFTHIRVLALPTSFAADWVEKGYPMEKGIR